MKRFSLLVSSLEYIEQHIGEDIHTDDIAAACFCSRSALEKLFSCVNNISVRSYIKRRRMMLAARRLIEDPECSILSVALEYGYSSHEAFARAFREVWFCNPSQIRGKRFVELFPKLREPVQKGDPYIMARKSVDISELYDLFVERSDCWFVLSDIDCLIPINEISRKAGDLAIIEQMNRMVAAAGEEDVVFRIGGDEFCMLTDSASQEYAEAVVQKIKALNGQCIDFEGRQIPLSLHVTATKYSGKSPRYSELFEELHTALREEKGISPDAVGN